MSVSAVGGKVTLPNNIGLGAAHSVACTSNTVLACMIAMASPTRVTIVAPRWQFVQLERKVQHVRRRASEKDNESSIERHTVSSKRQ